MYKKGEIIKKEKECVKGGIPNADSEAVSI